MAVKYIPNKYEVENHIFKNCKATRAHELKNILNQLSQNKALTTLSLKNKEKNIKLNATVGKKFFNENLFNGPYRILKRALKQSQEESQIELIASVLDHICS